MLRIAIGLLLVVSSSTGRLALIGHTGNTAMFLLGVLLIALEYVRQAVKHRHLMPVSIRDMRPFVWFLAR